jgi:phage shock protein E
VRTWTLALVALVIGLALATTGLACSGASSSGIEEPDTSYVTVGVNEAYQGLSIMNVAAQIVDVREPSEWAATGVPVGAVLIPLGELKERAPLELAKDQPVYVICNSGNRSQTGAQILIDLGYPKVYNVDGGIRAWLASGLPVAYP